MSQNKDIAYVLWKEQVSELAEAYSVPKEHVLSALLLFIQGVMPVHGKCTDIRELFEWVDNAEFTLKYKKELEVSDD